MALPASYLLGPRDAPAAPTSALYGRATRALNNFTENFAPFAALALALMATGHSGGWGATAWVVARIVYLPMYLLGVRYVRTAAAFAAHVGVLMMLARLVFAT